MFTQGNFLHRAFVRADTQFFDVFRGFQHAFMGDKFLAGSKVRHAEVHFLGALVSNGEVGGDQIDLFRYQQRNTVGRIGGPQLHLHTQRFADRIGDIHIVTHQLFALRVDITERRIAVEHRDTHYAGFLDVVEFVRMRGTGDEAGQAG
ncbi:hypothetical protein D3C72_1685790 [compost metagenome]